MSLISTFCKSPISKHMSYVLGAEAVSTALEKAPQLDMFELHFHGPYPIQPDSSKDRLVMRVNYSRSGPSIHNPRGSQSGPWFIRIYAVPRKLKSMIRKSLLEDVLPNDIVPWLIESGRFDGREGELMRDVYFKPGTQECFVQPYRDGADPRRAE